MRFTCGECNAQYMISDDKVGTKGVRVRCKKCGNVVTVRPKSESEPTEPEREDTQVSGAPDESLPEQTTVDQPEEQGNGFNVGDEEIGDALDSFLGDEGGEGEFDGEDMDDEDRPDFDRQSTRVFSVDEMQKVQEEREQAEQEAEERQGISDLYQSAQAEGGEAGEARPADETPAADEPSEEERERVEWYAAVDEQQVGPMSITEIGTRWEQGEFDAETLVWKTGFGDWLPIFEVNELKFLLAEQEPPPAAEERPEEREETEEGEREEVAGWGEEDTWGEEEDREEKSEAEPEEEFYDEDDALSAASSAAFAGADVDWKPSAVAELNALAEEELASLKPPPDPEPEEEQLPFGSDMGMPTDGEETGESGEIAEMEDGDSSIIGQIAAEEEAAAKLAEEERAEEEKRSEEVRKKKEEEELAAQEAARREREAEKRERAAPPPEQVIPPRGSIPKWALGVMGGSGLVIVILLGFIAYKLASGSGNDEVTPAAEPIKPPAVSGVHTPPKGPDVAKPEPVVPTPPSPTPTEAAKTAAVTPSPEVKDTAKEEKKAVTPLKRKPPLGKKKKKKKRKVVAEKAKEAPPPPPAEEPKPPPRGKKKRSGSLLDFEDEAAFSAETGSKDPVKRPPPKSVKKELPPLSNADVLGVMRQHIAEFKACNRKQKEVDPSVKGKMVVSFVVNPNGRVSNVKVTTAQFKKTFVANCISKVIRQLNFPQFGGKPKKVPFPFTVK